MKMKPHEIDSLVGTPCLCGQVGVWHIDCYQGKSTQTIRIELAAAYKKVADDNQSGKLTINGLAISTGIAYCIGCGCDDRHACAAGCWWLRVDYTTGTGVCSECRHHVERFDDGARHSFLPRTRVSDTGPTHALDLSALTPTELSAAMRGGTLNWGVHGSAAQHIRYSVLRPLCARRKCHCGCGRRATHAGMANGVCLMIGCELHVHRWARQGK